MKAANEEGGGNLCRNIELIFYMLLANVICQLF